MLQIISGKFYLPDADVTERPVRDVLYSNVHYHLPIETSVARLELANSDNGVATYIVDYVCRLDQKPGHLRVLNIGRSTIMEQIRLLALFSLKGYFSRSRDQVVKLCHEIDAQNIQTNAASYIQKFLRPALQVTPAEVELFRALVDKAIAMPRRAYEKLVDCLTCFADAVELSHNADLAYSMLVYCAEAISQEFDSYTPLWADVQESTRKSLDVVFEEIHPDAAQKIKDIILAQQHFKLQKRFIDFITNHLPESFYTRNADGLICPIRPSELKPLLVNVYTARSKFVHTLKSVQHQLKDSEIAKGEVFHSLGAPHITFNGMARLVHTVLATFIDRQPRVDIEVFNWRKSLPDLIPGVVELPPSPIYWIYNSATATPGLAARRLTGFLSCILTDEIRNLRDVIEAYLTTLPSVQSEKEKLHMALLCELYLYFFATEPELSHLKARYAPFQSLLRKPSVHAMLFRLLKNQRWDWAAEKSADLYLAYERQRSESEFSIPITWELSLILEVSNQFLSAGKHDKSSEWKKKAHLEAVGHGDIQANIEKSIALGGRFHLNGLLLTFHDEQDQKVKEKAYTIYLRRMASNELGDDLSDWLEAEMSMGVGN